MKKLNFSFQSSLLFLIGLLLHSFAMSADKQATACTDQLKSGLSDSDHFRILHALKELIDVTGKIPSKTDLAAQMEIKANDLRVRAPTLDIDSLVQELKRKEPLFFLALRTKYVQKMADFVVENFGIPDYKDILLALNLPGNTPKEQFKTLYGDLIENYTALVAQLQNVDLKYREKNSKKLATLKEHIIDRFSMESRTRGRDAKGPELADNLRNRFDKANVDEKKLRALFGETGLFKNMADLWDQAVAANKGKTTFNSVVNTNVYTKERDQALLTALVEKDVFYVTSALAGAHLDQAAFQALLIAAQKNNGAIIVYAINGDLQNLPEELLMNPLVHILTHKVVLGDIVLDNMKLTAKMVTPLTGLDKYGDRDKTYIFGAPKMMANPLPGRLTKNDQMDVYRITVGTITAFNQYGGPKYIQGRTADLADDILAGHRTGALVLEKAKGNRGTLDKTIGSWNFRRMEYDPKWQGYIDQSVFYGADGAVLPMRAAAIKFGDLHFGETNAERSEQIKYILQKHQPLLVVQEDTFDAASISHHEKDQRMTLWARYQRGELDFESMLRDFVRTQNQLMSLAPKDTVFAITDSNHNDFVDRWLQSNLERPELMRIKSILETAKMRGENLMQFILTSDHPDLAFLPRIDSRFKSRLVFWDGSTSVRVGRKLNPSDVLDPAEPQRPEEFERLVEMAVHGHHGNGGARGSNISIRLASGEVLKGHDHMVSWNGGVGSCGNMIERPNYAKSGGSSWAFGYGVAEQNGRWQVHIGNKRNGRFWAEPNEVQGMGKKFYAIQPYLLPNQEVTKGGDDQWGTNP